MDAEELAIAYLHYFETKRKEDRWAWAEVDDLVRRDPQNGWEVTRILVNRSTSEEALGFVAAGPLEDLLKKHGSALIDRIEDECRENDRLRVALSGVSIGADKPVFERWYALMWKYGFAEGKRTGL
ncbi:MAG TPA: hypothetical protein VGD60_06950 [Candidatus Acidoferrales bacterium]